MVDLIYVPSVDSHQLRMKVFPLSLADDARQWWINEWEGKITVWEELVEKFLCKFYPESYDGEEEMLDEGDNWGIDPLEFISRNKRRMDDIILSNNNTTADSFFKPYLITRGECNTKKEDEQRRYGVSVPALTKDHKGIKLNTPYPEDQYAVLEIWNEYNILEDIKHGPYSKKSPIRHMAPLPPREQRHPFLRYQGLEYTDEDIANFEERLERIYSREIHRVHVVDFQGMPELIRDGLFARMVMEHHDDLGVVIFTS
ncbi:hypothetical protein Tco_0713866 [Tanacetum coccineum]